MVIRQATDSDTPQIVSLLKQSLGETFLPKSVQYWNWKHIENPFGRSPVLLAEDNNMLIGVRAFMRWTWTNGSQTIQAVRAVDTATHPAHQGKGIFSKLTMTLLKECEINNTDLVFNTPNNKSMPGYLKMGWYKAGKLPIEVRAVRPFSMVANKIRHTEINNTEPTDNTVEFYLNHPALGQLLKADHNSIRPNIFQTSYSVAYLNWRYVAIPVANYFAVGIERGNELTALLIYRLKSTGWGVELRVTDLFVSSKEAASNLRKLLYERAAKHKVHFITYAGLQDERFLHGLLSFKSLTLGPVVTIRDVRENKSGYFAGFKQWAPTLGDMELF